MQLPEKGGFIVLECKKAPFKNNTRICLPKSWIMCEMREKKVAFAYPGGNEAIIAKKIKNQEPADNTWRHYIGKIKFEAESYADAIAYLQSICRGNGKKIEDNSYHRPFLGTFWLHRY